MNISGLVQNLLHRLLDERADEMLEKAAVIAIITVAVLALIALAAMAAGAFENASSWFN
ncbi:hypothetical protein [uncultured Parasphingorhabdus sp.]|jgi:hypothetical protein|uniref:hypothetical protein n=1 Tax=uncultured Parasphingorhabdus sp. TaxID=2709694 RepID=UPI002AA7F4A1|nr:hypothetical protein [uncultured Parasphingorhabdus sp.]